MNIEVICETGPTVYCPYTRRLESLTIYRRNYKDSSYFKILSVDPARVRTRDLPHDSTMPNKLSHR